MSVVNLFERKKDDEETETPVVKQEESFDFSKIMEENRKKAEREKQDMAKANKGVIRSYRLKH